MQAVILAAGRGNRLGKLGENTKALTNVAGRPIIDYTIKSLEKANINKLIVVVGYKGNLIENYLYKNYPELDITIIDENKYTAPSHNNIYSLSLCSDYLEKDDTILIESDILIKEDVISNIINDSTTVVVSKYIEGEEGSTVFCDHNNKIVDFDNSLNLKEIYPLDQLYKTVNIYLFKKEFSKTTLNPLLKESIEKYGVNSFYESCLYNDVIKYNLKAYILNNSEWSEVDTPADFDIADIKFETRPEERYNKISSMYGGYWKFPEIIDCCYLNNAFFSPEPIYQKIKNNLESLISSYPVGEFVIRKNAGRLFDINPQNILVANGASEFIKILGNILKGNIYIPFLPTFNEYIQAFENRVISNPEKADIYLIVNPNNPTNDIFEKDALIDFISKAKSKNKLVIIDESFLDFVDNPKVSSLINDDFLIEHDNLIIIKSLGKSYNINGIKLGILTSGNFDIIKAVRDNLPVWNVNALSSLILQELPSYKEQYTQACKQLINERNRFIYRLQELNQIKVLESNTNFIIIDLLAIDSHTFCVDMLDQYNIYIKDLKNKFDGKRNLIRLSVNLPEINGQVLRAFHYYFSI